MIDLDTVRAIWFMEVDAKSNWMGAVCLEPEGYIFRFRVRYYVDDKLDDTTEDIFRWSASPHDPNTTEAAMIEKARYMARMLQQMAIEEYQEIIVGHHDSHWLVEQLKVTKNVTVTTKLLKPQ